MYDTRKIFALGVLLAPSTIAHSWIEQMQVIGSNGSYVGAYGYPRGYVARADVANFENGLADQWLLPPTDGSGQNRINGTELLCHPYQRTANYSAEYPMLKVSSGDYVAMKYLENGHVTQPWVQQGKPYGGGTVFVYGTTQPDPNTKIVDVLKWNAAGTGGDKKGWLMTAQQFDDERCHQMSSSPISLFRQQQNPDRVPDQPSSNVENWCETDLKIPEKVEGSTLTAYWVWQWSTAAGTPNQEAGQDEYYITCLDFDVQAAGAASNNQIAAASTLEQQDPQTVAPPNWQSRTARTTSASWTTWNAKNVAAAATQIAATSTTYWSVPAATFVTGGSTYQLENMGTALMLNGQVTAFVDCTNAVTTGSVLPSCSSSASSAAPAATSLPPTVPAAAAPAPSTPAATTVAASAPAAGTTETDCMTNTVTVTAMVTVSVPAAGAPSSAPAAVTLSSTPAISSTSLSFTYPTLSVPNYATAAAGDQAAAYVQASMGGTAEEHMAQGYRRHARSFHVRK